MDEQQTAFIEDDAGIPPAPWYKSRRAALIGAVALTSAAAAIGVGLSVATSGASAQPSMQALPVVISTWFPTAVQEAYNLLSEGYTALDAVELGCTVCEDERCDGTVGWGGSPDVNGETTLDAFIMDAETHVSGAVTYLRRVKHAINVARKIMTYTEHSVLAGDGATNFSLMMGLQEEDLHSQESRWIQGNWTSGTPYPCQPNYWNPAMLLGSNTSCGPFVPLATPTYAPAYTPLPVSLPGGRVGLVDRARVAARGRLASATPVPTKMVSRGFKMGASDYTHDTM